MQTLLNLFNQALTAIGNSGGLTDPQVNKVEANLLRLWYPVARHAVFGAAYWDSIRKTKRLGRVAERVQGEAWANGAPAPGFLYSYALPSDLLQPQYMEDFSQFRLGRVGNERVIYSNNPTPILNYTMDDPVPGNWQPELYRCVIWALAACVNMARSGKMAVTQKLEQQVQQLIAEAAQNAANADDTYFDAIPSLYAGTDFSPPMVHNRYYYPTSTFRVEGLAS